VKSSQIMNKYWNPAIMRYEWDKMSAEDRRTLERRGWSWQLFMSDSGTFWAWYRSAPEWEVDDELTPKHDLPWIAILLLTLLVLGIGIYGWLHFFGAAQ
jgi:hypothetical protein